MAVAALSALVLGAYANSLGNGFVWDDNLQILMNPDLRPDASWTNLFSSDVWGYHHGDQPAQSNYYRPLQMVSYRLVSALFGLSSQPLHTLSLGFALAAVLAAFLVYWELTRSLAIAFVAAALFAVHPVHAEAVDWISALPEVGCATFVLLSFGFYLRTRAQGLDSAARPQSSALPWLPWTLSVLMFATALLWKETALVFPLLIAAHAICIGSGAAGQRLRSAARLTLPFWGVLAIYLALRFRVLGFLTTPQRIWDLTPVQAGMSALHLLALYWWKLILPIHLNAYYLFSPVRSLLDARAVVGILFAVLSLAGIWYARRRAPLAVFAALWVFLALLPVMNIYVLGRNVFAERYLYLPSLGFCLLAVLAVKAAMRRLPPKASQPASLLLLVVVLVWFTAQTIARSPDWHDDASLFRQALVLSPDAPFVHYMVASSASDDPATASSAEAHYLKAIALAEGESPADFLDLSRAYEGLASLYADRGDSARALEVLHKWRSAIPGQSQTDIEEGLILLRSGKWQEAEPLLRRAFAVNPQNENLLNALGLLAWEYQHRLDEAAGFFTHALAIHTAKDDFRASLHSNLGGVYGDRRNFPAAAEQFRSAVDISPDNPEFRTNLATALAAMGRYGEASVEATSALRIDPNYAPARALLQQLNGQATPRP